ncbi:MAG: DUF6730 family protein [Bacteroidota bacterium]
MNKLETITELLVNELTDFEKNVTKLSNQIDKAESLRVKFDVLPIKGLISQLEEFGRKETEKRNRYLERLQYNLKQAKIYPKWAVITFIIAIIFAFLSAYYTITNSNEIEEQAYRKGLEDYAKYIDSFMETNPETKKKFEKWSNQN